MAEKTQQDNLEKQSVLSKTNTAIDKYALSHLFIVPQYWYNNEATISLANSNEPAIINTSVVAPANCLLKPNTE